MTIMTEPKKKDTFLREKNLKKVPIISLKNDFLYRNSVALL